MTKIHPTAIVDPDAVLGDDVAIGPYAVIEGGVSIGAGCDLGPYVFVRRHSTIGAGCRIHAGAVVGDLPQDLGFKGAVSYVRIGKGCTIREHVTIHRGTKPETVTELGDNCFLMADAHLAHNVKVGNRVIIANGAMLGGYVEVGDGAFLSGNVGIHQFVRIGRLAMMGGTSTLTKDVPPFCTVRAGTENKVAGMNIVGMRRAGLSPADRQAVKQAFRMLYRSGLNVAQAVERLRESNASPLVREIVDFIGGSRRGICGPAWRSDGADGESGDSGD